MTPATASTPYITAADLIRFVDWRVLADLAHDGDGPRPTRRSLTDPDRPAGAFVAEHLLAASGEFESALAAGGRYSAADLAALTGAGLRYCKRLVSSLCHWSMAQGREPAAADPENVPGAAAALAVLEQLRAGERILPFAEAAAAGGGPTATPSYDVTAEPGGGRLVNRAGRLFDTRE